MKALTFLEFYEFYDEPKYLLDCGFWDMTDIERYRLLQVDDRMDGNDATSMNDYALMDYLKIVNEPMNEKMLFKFDYDESILKRVDFYEEDNKVCLSTSDKVVSAVCLIVDDYIRLFKINNLNLEWKNES